MLQEVHCDECGGTAIGLGEYCVNVEFNKSDWCDKCYQSKQSVTQYFFCSEKCFIEYIHKVVREEKTFQVNRQFRA